MPGGRVPLGAAGRTSFNPGTLILLKAAECRVSQPIRADEPTAARYQEREGRAPHRHLRPRLITRRRRTGIGTDDMRFQPR